LCALFMAVVVATALFGAIAIRRAARSPVATAAEMGLLGTEASHA